MPQTAETKMLYKNVKRIYFQIAEPGDPDCVDVQFPAELSKRIEVLNPKKMAMSNKCNGCKRGKAQKKTHTGEGEAGLGAMLRGAGIKLES